MTKNVFLPNSFHNHSHLLTPKSKGWLCQQRKIYLHAFPNRVFNIICIVSTDDFIYFSSFWGLSCDRCNLLQCKCLINTYTHTLTPLFLHLRGGKCLGFPSVPVFQSRSVYTSPGLNTSWYSCSRDSYTELQAAFSP